MPLFQETVSNPSKQDLIDLKKIYNELPQVLQNPKKTEQTLEQWIISFTQHEHCQLYASRFNDRLLGAFTLDTQALPWTLANLCVRQVTYRRGVGKALIQHSMSIAKQHNQTLQAKIPSTNEACVQLLSTNGWVITPYDNEWLTASFTP